MDPQPDTPPAQPKRRKTVVVLGLLTALVLMAVVAKLAFTPSAEELTKIRAALEQGALLLDVRTPGEFSGGHLHGAVNLPVAELPGKLDTLPKDKPLVVY